jgi:hypothetical protein
MTRFLFCSLFSSYIKKIPPVACHINMSDDAEWRKQQGEEEQAAGKKQMAGTFVFLN